MSLIEDAEENKDYSLCVAYEKFGLEPDWNRDEPTTTTEWFTSGLDGRGLFNFFETTETTTTIGPVNDIFEKGHPRLMLEQFIIVS